MRPWSDFDGGWTYDYRFRGNVVFESPCGLLWKRNEVSYSGHMSFMGVEWTEENNCITVLCPRYDRSETCELNHPLLENHPTGGTHYEYLCFCALHETSKPWDYEHSAEKVREDQEAVKDALWKSFAVEHHDRVCRNQCRYNRKTREWTAQYDPTSCPTYRCRYCMVLGKELDSKRGNVFYDVKIVRTEKGEGLFDDEQRVQIIKGKKLFDRPCSLSICRAAAKACAEEIQWKERMHHHMDLFLERIDSVEVVNIRAEAKESRDLLQDLRDVKAGIRVEHVSDQQKAAKAKASEKRQIAAKKKQERLEKRVVAAGGMENLSDYERRRIKKFVGEERIETIASELEAEKAGIGKQFSMFEEEL